MIDDQVLTRIRGLIKTMNPGAKVVETSLRASNQIVERLIDINDHIEDTEVLPVLLPPCILHIVADC